MMKTRMWLAALMAVCMLAGCVLPGLSEEIADEPEGIVVEAEEETVEDAAYTKDDESFVEGEVFSGEVESLPVEAEVEEVSLDLGGSGDDADDGDLSPLSEAEIEADIVVTDPDDFSGQDVYLRIPDIYDENFIRSLMPSERIYPGLLVWPLQGQTPLTHVTSHVGWRDAYRIQLRQGGTWATWLHHGVDVAGVGTDQVVVAADAGVAYAGHGSGVGNYAVIDHGNGWYTRYQHLSRFAGSMYKHARAIPVAAGEPIGYVGNSGGDYPVHFHFEIAWSPEGPGSDDVDFSKQTSNRRFYAYSFPQQRVVTLSWAKTWEICTAEYQFYYDPEEAPKPEAAPAPEEDEAEAPDDESEAAVEAEAADAEPDGEASEE